MPLWLSSLQVSSSDTCIAGDIDQKLLFRGFVTEKSFKAADSRGTHFCYYSVAIALNEPYKHLLILQV